MSDILDYSLAVVQAVFDCMAQPPILYLNGFLIVAVTITIFNKLVGRRYF